MSSGKNLSTNTRRFRTIISNKSHERDAGIASLYSLQWQLEMAMQNLNLLNKFWFSIIIRKEDRSQSVCPVDSMLYYYSTLG